MLSAYFFNKHTNAMISKKALQTLITGSLLPATAWAQGQQPNIIMFLVDDMGWQETSVPFYKERTLLNDRYRTPNMERLAQMGVKFTNAYACPVSSPSRCSLLSGMNAARHRVTNWIQSFNTNTNASGGALTLPEWNYNGIQPATTTNTNDLQHSTLVTPLPQLLKDAGYMTIHVGKGNFGATNTSASNPQNVGFFYNIGGGANGAPGSYLAAENYGSGVYHVAGLESYYDSGTFLTEALTLEALKRLKQAVRMKRPFFLYMSQYAIHTPYDADTRFTGNYMEGAQGVYDAMLKARLNTQEINHAALIEGMDKSLGDLMDYLQENDSVAQNTIILFMSDNGGQAVSVRQGRANHDQNYPARGGKGSAYDGGVHEPMIVYWPGVTQGGTENSNRVMIEDFFPTILSMAGVKNYETVQTIDGCDFSDLLRDPTLRRERVGIWHYPNRWGETADRAEGYGTYSAIMKGNYHLIYFWENQERRLYDLAADPSEENNLAESKPDVLKALAQELTDSLKSMDAQRPTLTATGQVVPWPNEAQTQETYATGDPLPPSRVVKLSSETEKTYYTISDNRPASAEGPFFWTVGEHQGYKALQCTNENLAGTADSTKQLFYFMQGSQDKTIHMFTFDDQPVDFVEGTCITSWNATNTTTSKFLQYGTPAPGEFQLLQTDYAGYYGFRTASGDLMNDRGTSHGSALNMHWVIMPYSGNHLGDAGSRYALTEAGKYEKPVAVGDVVEPNDAIFKMSSDSKLQLYTIEDNRPTPFFWTRGIYLDQKALQCTTTRLEGDDQSQQLFYFKPSTDDNAFTIYTADGEPVDYVNGTARKGWSNYETDTFRFMQYGTDQAGQLQLIKSAYDGYYGLRIGDELISDRGTSHGTEANMNWVIMTYSGNHLGDQGSRYKFSFVKEAVPVGIQLPQNATNNLKIFDLNGRQITHPQGHGVYIIRQGGKSQKVLK